MADANLYTILTTIQTDVQALTLPGIGAENIIIQKVPSNQDKDLPAVKYPCIIIAPFGREQIPETGGTNLRDDIIYPVVIAIIASEKDEAEQPRDRQLKNFEKYLKWRETIRKSFLHQRISSTLGFKVELEPLDIVERGAFFDRNLYASAMVLKISNRETRG